MKEPEKFPKVLTGVMIGITALFTSLGALSYATFGSETKTVILLNLPQQSHLVQTVQGLYSIAIMLSIPLQLFPAIRIMETCFFTKSGKYNLKVKWQKNTFRVLLLFVCAAIAIWAGDDLDKFVSIIGSVACKWHPFFPVRPFFAMPAFLFVSTQLGSSYFVFNMFRCSSGIHLPSHVPLQDTPR